ncbi:putative antibiotic biosynthesis monooxygenase [Ameyamaea chiangmaiensis NBRC 103196]|uniref:Antibiotic biosynthesis monooxygenase n=1 Tax=Ameyamaea chiangmaiensis TaxID=442969 RepID=A0A850PCN5_9PROT|nr:putative quinol monooxygenase [Ameyamaea chiangmaiensis]MBS4075697.1 antibiotic biosynthesis monooxygenase [Ameyamaea chiangmaiensis]NVN40270.1 antibiotic biosynthesis monooxygenase [Ameyamaea chiangmaiensis]GBQ70473.1 putative antibiotic biosynthesis monooxygenase [Ameyamaea chiangmaiensis NBRC 103196]
MEKALYATMRALPGQEEAVAELLRVLTPQVQAEPGNLRFVVYRLSDDPASFHVEETYRDEAAFQTHIGMEHGKAFNAAITTLVEGGASNVVFLTPVV